METEQERQIRRRKRIEEMRKAKRRAELLQKWGITRLQPYFTATNLLTWTSYSGMDPEVNQWGNSGTVQGIDWGTYPHSRSYVFGINVEF